MASAERPGGAGAATPRGTQAANDAHVDAQAHIDLSDPASIRKWCEHFGITEQQLDEAIKAVGPEPAAVREHLLNQGSSAGAG